MNLQPPTTLHIRPMQVGDLEQVHAIDRVSFSMPWPESSYRYELLENPHSRLWVTEATGPGSEAQIVGALVIWLIEDEAHIATLSVHPDFRGQGIGHEMLAAALKDSIQAGARLATLEVRANNLVAQTLYRRFLFEVAGRRPRYYRDNFEDALIMTVEGLDDGYASWLESGKWKK